MTHSASSKPVTRDFPSEQTMMDAAAEELTVAAQQAVHARGRCVLVLDTSPLCLRFYAHWVARTETHAFWSYSLVFQARNARSAASAGGSSFDERDEVIQNLPVPMGHVFGIGSSGAEDPDTLASRYERTIRMVLELRPRERPSFDIVFLELDAAGRVGGLAEHEWADYGATRLVRLARADRRLVTLSAFALASTRQMLLIHSGSRSAARAGLRQPHAPHEPALGIPAALVAQRMAVTVLNTTGN